jgi:hypothetical protein
MPTTAAKAKTGDVRIRIEHDDCPDDPRDDEWPDKLICWTRRYNLGDKHAYDCPEDMFMDILSGADRDALRPIMRGMMRYGSLRQAAVEWFHGMENRKDEWYGFIEHNLWHIGDEGPPLLEEAARKAAVILPVYLHDHSEIALNTTGFHCPWDSGQLGFIYMTHADILKHSGHPTAEEKASGKLTEDTRGKMAEDLSRTVETYSQYVAGDAWGFIFERADACSACGRVTWEHEDSCWGFLGTDFNNGMADHIEEKHHELLKEALANAG